MERKNIVGAIAQSSALLPSEPRIINQAQAQALTERYLLPVLAELEIFFLEVRSQIDNVLSKTKPFKQSKPYPLGQCLEISLAVADAIKTIDPVTLSDAALAGYRALSAFFAAGGSMRRIWGDLRGEYFQNAFLLGTLYVDVSNDTVVTTKPKIEILPFAASGLTPIADYAHFAHIARRYWQASVWPNHIVPELAPFFPVVTISKYGRMEFRDAGDYLMIMNWREAFRPSESFLAGAPMPQEVFNLAVAQLRNTPHRLAKNPVEGRRLALQNARTYRKKRWHQQPEIQQRMLEFGLMVNRSLAQINSTARQTTKPMNILFVHRDFPGQFKHLVLALVQRGHKVIAMTMQQTEANSWHGVTLTPYCLNRDTTPNIHPWLSDFEAKTIRGEACLRSALRMKADGYAPDIIIAGPDSGEGLFLKDVWPEAKLGIYCEHHAHGADVDFDPEFSVRDTSAACRLRLTNLGNLLNFQTADAGISPTYWQADTFPKPFRSRITVVHDGIDTEAIQPNPNIGLTLNASVRLTKQDEVITFASRNLEPCRGYHIFMRALPEILKRRPNARVLIAGADDVSDEASPENGEKWKDIFTREVWPQISDADWARVHFLGNIPYQHLIALLQLSTVHVYLTYPFVPCWSLLEAMSAGCTIVASDTQPLHEAIKHNETGRLVNFFDVQGLANEVCDLLDNPAGRQRLGQNARKFVQETYDLKTVCLPKQLEWVERLVEPQRLIDE